jgi:inner membrane protease subunit 1
MHPCLHSGDWVLVDTGAFARRRPRHGEVVLTRDPRFGQHIIKRIDRIDANGVVILGDNPDYSTDSRHFGPVPVASIAGRVRFRYWPGPRPV